MRCFVLDSLHCVSQSCDLHLPSPRLAQHVHLYSSNARNCAATQRGRTRTVALPSLHLALHPNPATHVARSRCRRHPPTTCTPNARQTPSPPPVHPFTTFPNNIAPPCTTQRTPPPPPFQQHRSATHHAPQHRRCAPAAIAAARTSRRGTHYGERVTLNDSDYTRSAYAARSSVARCDVQRLSTWGMHVCGAVPGLGDGWGGRRGGEDGSGGCDAVVLVLVLRG